MTDVTPRPRVLLCATTTGYQTRMFDEAAARLGVELVLATDRCDRLDDPWRDRAIAVRFHDERGALAAIRAALPDDPWSIAAVHVVTTLTGSALLALALLRGVLDADQVWNAAHVDEDWNIEQWGVDEEVAARRRARLVDFTAAAGIIRALNPGA